jgi:hypothetical protein
MLFDLELPFALVIFLREPRLGWKETLHNLTGDMESTFIWNTLTTAAAEFLSLSLSRSHMDHSLAVAEASSTHRKSVSCSISYDTEELEGVS